MTTSNTAEIEIRAVLEAWAAATRQNQEEHILRNHAEDLVIFDVLPPMKYESAESYRRSWEEWQPNTQGEAVFNLENLTITSGNEVAFAHSFIRCGGTLADGGTFEDLSACNILLEEGEWVVGCPASARIKTLRALMRNKIKSA